MEIVSMVAHEDGSAGVLLTAEEAARFLAVSVSTLERLVRDGELGSIRVGKRSIRYSKNDLNEFIATRRRVVLKASVHMGKTSEM